MTLYFVLFLACCGLISCYETHNDDSHLVDVTPEMFPYHALVRSFYACGGVLVSENYVLTCAHCVDGSSIAAIYLGFKGYPHFIANHNEKCIQTYTSNEIIIHEDFAKIGENNYLNNIALIKLPNPVVLSDTVRPGKLISRHEEHLLRGKFVNITGWIRSTNTPLKRAAVLVRNQDTCSYLFQDGFLREQHICVNWKNSRSLNLLGNPVTAGQKIVGIQTNTPECSKPLGTCTQNDIVLNLLPFLDWISEHTGLDEPDTSNSNDDELINIIKNLTSSNTLEIQRLNSLITQIQNALQNLQLTESESSRKLQEEINDLQIATNSSRAEQFNRQNATEELSNAINANRIDASNRFDKLNEDLLTIRNTSDAQQEQLDELRKEVSKLFVNNRNVADSLVLTEAGLNKRFSALQDNFQVVQAKLSVLNGVLPNILTIENALRGAESELLTVKNDLDKQQHVFNSSIVAVENKVRELYGLEDTVVELKREVGNTAKQICERVENLEHKVEDSVVGVKKHFSKYDSVIEEVKSVVDEHVNQESLQNIKLWKDIRHINHTLMSYFGHSFQPDIQ